MTDTGDIAPPPAPIEEPDGWEDPPRRRPTTDVPVLSVEGFEGPLDWLLEMVRAHKIDLARLSILALVEAFATALQAGRTRRDTGSAAPLWRWGGWLVMAANLALLRSRLLLPADAREAATAHDEAEAIRRHLVERLRMAAAVAWLERRAQLGQEVFARGQPDAARSVSHVGDHTDLLRACLVALRLPDDIAVYRPRPPTLWRVADAVARIREMTTAGGTNTRPLPDFLPATKADQPDRDLRCRAALASTLVAGLELAREGHLTLEQEEPFGPMVLTFDVSSHQSAV